MKPGTFDYVRATSVSEAVEALGSTDFASVLAGGQSLVPLMNLRMARPDVIVDVNDIPGLDGLEITDGRLRIGALCRQRALELDPTAASVAPLMVEAVMQIGHVQIRNRGTVGGSIAHADPVSELPAALLAAEGSVVTAGPNGMRTIPASEFFVGPLTTALEPSELVTAVEIPIADAGEGSAFREFALRHGDFAIAGIGVIVGCDDGGNCTRVRIAGCGLGATPVDLSAAARGLVGRSELDDEALRTIAAEVEALVEPPGDIHASAEYKSELAEILTVRSLRAAWDRAQPQEA